MRHYQAFNRHAGFCKLCWKWTEERMTHDVLKVGKRREHERDFVPVERPGTSKRTLAAAHGRLKEIIAASKPSENNDPYLFAQLMYMYGVGYDRRIQFARGQVLFDESQESQEAQEIMLDRIEQELIDEEWIKQSSELGDKCFKPRLGDDPNAPATPSKMFCPDHNPRRSSESRRRYQNDRKLMSDFEDEVNRVYSQCLAECIGIHTDNDHQEVRRVAYRIIFTSTLNLIIELKAEGKTQSEIALILNITRQAVSNALRRAKAKMLNQ